AASPEERDELVASAAMAVAGQVDAILRELAARRLAEFRPELGRELVGEAIDSALASAEPSALARKLTPAEREGIVDSLARTYGDRLAVTVLADDVSRLLGDIKKRFAELGILNDRARARAPAPTVFERAMAAASDAVGFARSTVLTRIAAQLEGSHS